MRPKWHPVLQLEIAGPCLDCGKNGAVPVETFASGCKAHYIYKMTTNRIPLFIGLFLGLALAVGRADTAAWAQAKTCTEAQIAAAQDEGSAALKRLNAQTTPQIDAKLRELQKARGWSDHDLDDKAYEQLEDDTIRAFDRETATLITRMETLSEPTNTLPACERLVELRQTLERMRDVSQQKSRYLNTKLDQALSKSVTSAQSALVVRPAPVAPVPAPLGAAGGAPPIEVRPQEGRPLEGKVADPKPGQATSAWSTTSSAAVKIDPGAAKDSPSRASCVAFDTNPIHLGTTASDE